MPPAPPEENSTETEKRSRPTLEFSLSSGLVALANLLPDATHRSVASVIATPLGFGLAFAFRYFYRQNQHREFEELVKGWLREWAEELKQPGISPERAAEITADSARYRRLLQKKQLDNLDVKEE